VRVARARDMATLGEELQQEADYQKWLAAMMKERQWSSDARIQKTMAHKELVTLYKMFRQIAKDRKATKKEIKEATKAGKDPSKIDVGGQGDRTLTREEFVKKFSKKSKVVGASGKLEVVNVANAGLLFDQMDKDKNGRRGDGLMGINEYMLLMMMVRSTDPDKKLELAFAMYDENRSGSLQQGEILKMLLSLVAEENPVKRREIERNLITPEVILDKDGKEKIGADGKPQKGLLFELMHRADGEYNGSQDGKGDGNVTLKELHAALKDDGWLKDYLGDGANRDAMVTGAFQGKSSMCLVM